MERQLLHPALRRMPMDWVVHRASWYSFLFPAEERILFMGDVRLYCRDQDYQNVLDCVPCPTTTDANGNGRYCALAGSDLDAYRLEVERWVKCFDDAGNQVSDWRPKQIKQSVEPTVVAGPRLPRRAPWYRKAK